MWNHSLNYRERHRSRKPSLRGGGGQCSPAELQGGCCRAAPAREGLPPPRLMGISRAALLGCRGEPGTRSGSTRCSDVATEDAAFSPASGLGRDWRGSPANSRCEKNPRGAKRDSQGRAASRAVPYSQAHGQQRGAGQRGARSGKG